MKPVHAPAGVGALHGEVPFPQAAAAALGDSQLRRNLGHATATIRAKRSAVVAELDDWEELRLAGQAIKAATLSRLDEHLLRLEQEVITHGGQVHWARDAAEANRIVVGLVQATGADEVVKVKSMATQEIGLNEALEQAGIAALETDLAELIVQLGHDKPSHILVPAIHRNRAEIREIFRREMAGVDPELTDDPRALAMAAREHLRRKFLTARVAVSGANFAVAETGTLVVVESEGNGRMCLTLPQTLITVMGVEKLVPTWTDLEVFLQLLPRSSTGERMNPYTSMWTGVSEADGPQEFHLVLVDNGRTAVLSDPHGRDALHCIRCSACLNVCPVYERTGGHVYGSVYPGPIGAVLTPQLTGTGHNSSLPFASTLCGACFDACPVRIDIPSMLVHLRSKEVEARRIPAPDTIALSLAAKVMARPRLFALAGRLARILRWRRGLPRRETVTAPNSSEGTTSAGRHAGQRGTLAGPGDDSGVGRHPGGTASRQGRAATTGWLPFMSAWTKTRDLPTPPTETFREWWLRERGRS